MNTVLWLTVQPQLLKMIQHLMESPAPLSPSEQVVVHSLSHVSLFATPWTVALQASLSFTISWVCSNSCALDQWCHPNFLTSVPLFSSCLLLYQHQDLFQWVGRLHQVAKLLELQLQYQSFQWIFRTDFLSDCLVWFSCYPRDSQECSPTPQFKSINYSGLSFLYSRILTSRYNYWKHHRFDQIDLCWQSNVSAFSI